MSFSEFPHTNYEDTDSMELIILYRKLVDNYEGTLHQIEELRKMLDEYQKTMDSVIDKKVTNKVNSKVSKALEEVNADIAKVQEAVNTLAKNTDLSVNDLQSQITAICSELNTLAERMYVMNDALMLEIVSKSRETLAESIAYTAKQISAVEDKLTKQIEEIEASTGHKAIRWLWQYGCYHGGFEAGEWYYLTKITAEDFDRSNITANRWYVDATRVFKKFDESHNMYSPVSGRWVDVRTALLELATALKVDGLTAAEYDALGITASEYEKYKITAQDYDWVGKEILCSTNKQNS